MSFHTLSVDDRIYLTSNIFPQDKICHGFTTSLGGAPSPANHDGVTGFNLGFRVNDNKRRVYKNYEILARDLNLSLDKTVLAKQTHTDNIRLVTEDDLGKGITRESDIEDTDGLICNIPGVTLVVFSADCVPILLYDKKTNAVAAIHSGWRGTVKNIGNAAILSMKKNFGTNPKDILAAIGPSIGPCCFEFDPDAKDIFEEKYITPKDNGKFLVDIWSKCADTLISSGVSPHNIDVSKTCTVCKSNMFYSYRAHKDKTGRQAAVIMLKP